MPLDPAKMTFNRPFLAIARFQVPEYGTSKMIKQARRNIIQTSEQRAKVITVETCAATKPRFEAQLWSVAAQTAEQLRSVAVANEKLAPEEPNLVRLHMIWRSTR